MLPSGGLPRLGCDQSWKKHIMVAASPEASSCMCKRSLRSDGVAVITEIFQSLPNVKHFISHFCPELMLPEVEDENTPGIIKRKDIM